MFLTYQSQLLVQLHVNAPTVRAHLWPARFVDGSTVDDRNLNGFYLIGLSLTPASKEKQLVREANFNIKSAITGALRAFETDIQSNARFYDPDEMFVCVANVSASQFPSTVILDAYQWPDGGFDDEVEDKDLTDRVDAMEDRDEGGLSSAPRKQESISHLPAAKLRTSSDVYNRLMWDPAVSKEDYVIGYEDRFKGVKETPLTSWKREVEDEAFVRVSPCLSSCKMLLTDVSSIVLQRYLSIVSFTSGGKPITLLCGIGKLRPTLCSGVVSTIFGRPLNDELSGWSSLWST
jgi:hypothetical protein